jgi:hypothetical protein
MAVVPVGVTFNLVAFAYHHDWSRLPLWLFLAENATFLVGTIGLIWLRLTRRPE